MTRVLLTGASGFIGRQCSTLLLSRGYTVHAVSRTVLEVHGDLTGSPGMFCHQEDLLSPGVPRRVVQSVKPDYLLHLAWYAIRGRFWQAPENRQWVRASMELFEAFAAVGGKRLVTAGSCAEYAVGAGECVEDRTPLAPSTLYGSAKHELRQQLEVLSKLTGLSAAWGRIFYLYGPHENPTRLVPYAICSLLRGEPALCSEGLQMLDFLHARDVASAFVALLGSRAQGPINIASGKPLEVRAVLTEIGRQIGRPELIQLGTRPSTSPPDRWWGNIARLANDVGWQPKFDLPSGLADVIRWWRNQLANSLTTPKEIQGNME